MVSRLSIYLVASVALTHMPKIHAADPEEQVEDGEFVINLEPQTPEEIGEDIGEEPFEDDEETFRDEEEGVDDEDWVEADNVGSQKDQYDINVVEEAPQDQTVAGSSPPPPIKPPVEVTLEDEQEQQAFVKQPMDTTPQNQWTEKGQQGDSDNINVPASQPRPNANAENGWNEWVDDATLADTPEPITGNYDKTVDETLDKVLDDIGTPTWYDLKQEEAPSSPDKEGDSSIENGDVLTSIDNQGEIITDQVAGSHSGPSSSSLFSFVLLLVILIIFLRTPQIKVSLD